MQPTHIEIFHAGFASSPHRYIFTLEQEKEINEVLDSCPDMCICFLGEDTESLTFDATLMRGENSLDSYLSLYRQRIFEKQFMDDIEMKYPLRIMWYKGDFAITAFKNDNEWDYLDRAVSIGQSIDDVQDYLEIHYEEKEQD